MKLRFGLPCIWLAVNLTGCAVIGKLPKQDLVKLDKNNFKHIEGNYSNVSSDSTIIPNNIGNALWIHVSQYKYDVQKFPNWKNQTVKIKMPGKHKITFELYEDDKRVKIKTIHGRLKDGYFYRRPFFLVIPFFPLWYGYWTDRSRFGIGDNKIYVDGKDNFWQFAILAGNSGKGQFTAPYKKLN